MTMFLNPNRRLCLLGTAAFLLSGQSHALDTPKGKVVLSLSGNIGQKNPGDPTDFDMEMLTALPQHSFTTLTPWYPEKKKFTGPLLRDVLAAVGAKGETIKAISLNNYKVEVPVADTQQFPVILARLMDDKPMAIRDKGPLFIVYPYDTDTALHTTLYYKRSAWQVRSIEVQ
jgi:hypothetical protein